MLLNEHLRMPSALLHPTCNAILRYHTGACTNTPCCSLHWTIDASCYANTQGSESTRTVAPPSNDAAAATRAGTS